jgi:hypothetical protein
MVENSFNEENVYLKKCLRYMIAKDKNNKRRMKPSSSYEK